MGGQRLSSNKMLDVIEDSYTSLGDNIFVRLMYSAFIAYFYYWLYFIIAPRPVIEELTSDGVAFGRDGLGFLVLALLSYRFAYRVFGNEFTGLLVACVVGAASAVIFPHISGNAVFAYSALIMFCVGPAFYRSVQLSQKRFRNEIVPDILLSYWISQRKLSESVCASLMDVKRANGVVRMGEVYEIISAT